MEGAASLLRSWKPSVKFRGNRKAKDKYAGLPKFFSLVTQTLPDMVISPTKDLTQKMA